MKRTIVWLVLLGLCAAAGFVRAHDEVRLAEIEERHRVLNEQVLWWGDRMVEMREEMYEEQKIRVDAVTRIVWMEAYLMALDHKFEASWEARYPGKVEALKAEGKWPVPRVPGYSLVELKESRDFLTRMLAQQVRQVIALGKRFETSATRIDAVVEAVRAAGIDVPLP